MRHRDSEQDVGVHTAVQDKPSNPAANQPKTFSISVIVPVRNEGRHIERTLDQLGIAEEQIAIPATFTPDYFPKVFTLPIKIRK